LAYRPANRFSGFRTKKRQWQKDGSVENVENSQSVQFGNSLSFTKLKTSRFLVEKGLSMVDSGTKLSRSGGWLKSCVKWLD
jgi:hypothetical protein